MFWCRLTRGSMRNSTKNAFPWKEGAACRKTDLKRTNSVRSPLSHGIRRASSPKGRAKRRNLLIEINPFYHHVNDNCTLILPLPLGEVDSSAGRRRRGRRYIFSFPATFSTVCLQFLFWQVLSPTISANGWTETNIRRTAWGLSRLNKRHRKTPESAAQGFSVVGLYDISAHFFLLLLF